ncbi:MAG: hypothetical protein A2Z14_05715 [Chloroflexi bacterium RBG_16_48_8]|nr:MAG: hypothetical protein A2Z14_05715 [Chloroflexi bacterium RBG_16_48_8]
MYGNRYWKTRVPKYQQEGWVLVARMHRRLNRGQFPKDGFKFDLEAMSCTCPAGQAIQKPIPPKAGRIAQKIAKKGSHFNGAIGELGQLRPLCTLAGPGKGQIAHLHPQERLLLEAWALQNSPLFQEYQEMR